MKSAFYLAIRNESVFRSEWSSGSFSVDDVGA
jgi:hypothetical protein